MRSSPRLIVPERGGKAIEYWTIIDVVIENFTSSDLLNLMSTLMLMLCLMSLSAINLVISWDVTSLAASVEKNLF